MAKAPKIDAAHLKAMLGKSKDGPVNCAIAFAEDGLPVMMLHKSKPARAILKMIEDEHGQVKNGRFGTAFVNTEEDAKLVILQLNKPVSGAAGKLKKALKGTGFSKIRIMLEDGTLAEADEAEEEAEGEAGVKDAGKHHEGFDAGAARHKLGELVKHMAPLMGGDPALAQELKQLATEAQAKLKANDASVEAVLKKLEAKLHEAKPGKEAGEHKAKVGKSKLAWAATLKKVHAEVATAKSEILEAIGQTELGAEVESAFSKKVEPSLGKLDHALHDALEKLEQAEGEAAHKTALAHAHKVIAAFEKHVSTDKTIAHLDQNPFAPVAIGHTLTTTLKALSGALGG